MAERLTKKQQAFVDAVLDPECGTLVEAYKRAYDTASMAPKVIRNEASTLRAHPGITMAVERGQRALERHRARNTERQRIEVAEPMPESEAEIMAEIESLFQDELEGGGKPENPDEG